MTTLTGKYTVRITTVDVHGESPPLREQFPLLPATDWSDILHDVRIATVRKGPEPLWYSVTSRSRDGVCLLSGGSALRPGDPLVLPDWVFDTFRIAQAAFPEHARFPQYGGHVAMLFSTDQNLVFTRWATEESDPRRWAESNSPVSCREYR